MFHNGKKSIINRKYTSFCELNECLNEEFPNISFPESSSQFVRHSNLRSVGSVETRRNNLQRYLRDLTLIPCVRKSKILRKFLDIDCPNNNENE